MDTLLQKIAAWKPFTAVVVGDFMLDDLVFGDAERLSADAPVPVLHARHSEQRSGGAANLCKDLAALRSTVRAIGVTGDDADAEMLRRAIEDESIDITGLLADDSRPTTVKRSLIGLAQQRHPQKMFRVDFESRAPIGEHVAQRLLQQVEDALDGADVLCIEDYAKGVCSERFCRAVIERARRRGVPVFVDPAKVREYAKYRSCSAITPNRNEAELATGLRSHDDGEAGHNAELARRLMEELDAEAIVLTLDRHGALLLERDGRPTPIPTTARQVYDVTGAGDMMLAALAAARANDFPWPEAVRFANAAAGLEVEVFGVEPIPLERIHHHLLVEHADKHSKTRTIETLLVELNARRARGESVVFTNGCFDVLHSGHVSLLEEAGRQGDFLIVAINDDDSVRRLKGQERPVNSYEERARVLAGLASVDAIIVFSDDTPVSLLERIRPDVLVKGGDYSRDQVIGGDLVESFGGKVVLVPPVPGRSSTKTIEKLRGT